MKNRAILFIFFSLFISVVAQGQSESLIYGTEMSVVPFAIINDKDGYTNVRDKNKKIIGKIYNNQVFSKPSYEEETNSYEYIVWNDGTSNPEVHQKNELGASGYLHHSRIRYLKDLPMVKRKIEGSDAMFLSDKYQIIVKTGRFVKRDHEITTNDDYIIRVDGYDIYGTDGILLDNLVEIKEISIRVDNKQYKVPAEYLTGYFSPALDYMFVALSDDNTFFISMSNGDGAGSYGVVWTIKNGKVVSVATACDF